MMSHVSGDSCLHVLMHDRRGVLYEGDAYALSGKNAVGPFDILPEHAHFVSIVSESVRIHLSSGVKDVPFDRGILRVHENKVEVYVGI